MAHRGRSSGTRDQGKTTSATASVSGRRNRHHAPCPVPRCLAELSVCSRVFLLHGAAELDVGGLAHGHRQAVSGPHHELHGVLDPDDVSGADLDVRGGGTCRHSSASARPKPRRFPMAKTDAGRWPKRRVSRPKGWGAQCAIGPPAVRLHCRRPAERLTPIGGAKCAEKSSPIRPSVTRLRPVEWCTA